MSTRRDSGLSALAETTPSVAAPRRRRPVPTNAVLGEFSALLRVRPVLRVVVLAEPGSRRVDEALSGWRDTDRLTLVTSADDPSWELAGRDVVVLPGSNIAEIHEQLCPIGPVDVVVDLRLASEAEHEEAWSELFYHVRAQGIWVIPLSALPARKAGPPEGLELGAGMSRLARISRAIPGHRWNSLVRAERELGRATRTVMWGQQGVAVQKRQNHLLKVRDTGAVELLERRNPRLHPRLLDSLPAREFTPAFQWHNHTSSHPMAGFQSTFQVPQMNLRAYRGKVEMASNQLVFGATSVLPESFRHPFEHNLRTTRLRSVSPWFGRVEKKFRARTHLPGMYYHLDSSNSGHFGHVMTEVLSRLWGWPTAKEQFPELKVIFRIRYEDERDPVLEKLLFGAFGIAEEDIVWAHQPVTLDGLVGATPMWHNQFDHFVHPEIRPRIWEPITERLAGDLPGGNERLFVSRRRNGGMNRLCRDADEVESAFVSHGFDIVYPEDYSLHEQAALFRGARVVAGFGGSAMFNLMHCRRLDHVIVLNSEGYIARNEHLYAAAHGARADYFWGVPDVGADPGSWTQASYTSPWRFDFDRNGAALDEVLRDLG